MDNDLSFNKHVSYLIKQCKSSMHFREYLVMSLEKHRLLMKAFIQSQFGYCLLIWMFHSRKLNNLINRIHERSLRIVYRYKCSTLQKILFLQDIQYLAIELSKVKNAISPEFMNDISPLKNKLLYCSKQDFLTTRVYSVYNGTETLSHLGPKIWLLIPNEIKAPSTLKLF